MKEELKEQILNGGRVIFEVVDADGNKREEIADSAGVLDLTVSNNVERMALLLDLYERCEIEFNDERYKVKCGFVLIADVILTVAGWMKDTAEDREAEEIESVKEDEQ